MISNNKNNCTDAAGSMAPRMGRTEPRQEQRSRTSEVGALGTTGAGADDCRDAGGTTPRMGDDCMDAGGRAMQGAVAEVESRLEQRSRATQGAVAEVEQRREQLPTTAGMQEVEQRREQLPSTLKSRALNSATGMVQPGIKMIRYRLDVGSKHQVTSEELKKVLIEESGVDKNNINNINIQGEYTLVELPDEMPQDIFLHLKSVEIKQRKLDIKRVKARNKKRNHNYRRRGRQRASQSENKSSDQVSRS